MKIKDFQVKEIKNFLEPENQKVFLSFKFPRIRGKFKYV